MIQKSKITGKYYSVDSLTLDEKVALGFDEAVVDELKKVNKEEKKSHAKKRKKDDD